MPSVIHAFASPAQRERLGAALAAVGGSLADWDAGKYWPETAPAEIGPLVVFTITGVPTGRFGWQSPEEHDLAGGPRVADDYSPTGAEYIVLVRATGDLVLRLDREGRLRRYRCTGITGDSV